MPRYEIINLGFSPADGERPELRFIEGDIHFSFLDWREVLVRFTAYDVRYFSWIEELDVPGIRDDVAYEVLESEVIRKYKEQEIISPDDVYRHFKICFNEQGVLDVVCERIAVHGQKGLDEVIP
jgi:hypothetical protein